MDLPPFVRKVGARFEGYAALVLLIAYAVVIMYDVLLRATLNQTTLWGFSVTLGIFAWVVWLTASLCIRTDSHLRFTLIRTKWSNRTNYYLRVLDVVLWWVVIGAVLSTSIPELIVRSETGVLVTGLPLPTYLFYASVPVGMGLMLYRSVEKLYLITTRYRNGDDVTPDASI